MPDITGLGVSDLENSETWDFS